MALDLLYVIAAMTYGLLGVAISASYGLCPRLRDQPAFHAFTALLIVLALVLVSAAATLEFSRFAAVHKGTQFFLFLAAGLCYVPATVFLVIHYSETVLERITCPGSRREPGRAPLREKEQWHRIQGLLELLAKEPSDSVAREKLADLYAHMGFVDSAVYEYRKAAEWLERGYAHGHVLYKAARLMVDRKSDIGAAVILLRRIIRLYPKSWFASWARRVLNHHEAHRDSTVDPR
jgi:tetratricopeptide (TPR) repeat protein